ncbi:NepR family anti-sigma factor [Altericroceibacterium endophyticum]|uniref:Anti-sigma factor NepR domain-containing protein n=1 Tax=Altericroceibacterium endophyticum TaxID=1808508 RepID=A0A6I4T5L5_9SPHN|nr:NepR family anti-sigma factor [Altericroceibacterium endophyticum]MXO65045.1 hypothetical protein [Altericroceibacterium endophyticum]
MTGTDKKENGDAGKSAGEQASNASKNDWTSGLKDLYDSVVDEPLPDSFKDLLAKLDDTGK